MKNIKNFIIDADNATFISITGSLTQPDINFYRGTEYILNFNVYPDYNALSGTGYDLTSATNFCAYIGSQYGISASPLVVSTEFNALSDWSMVSLSAGRISCKLNTVSNNLYYDLCASASKPYVLEVWYTNYYSSSSILVQNDITIKNIAATVTGA